MHTAVTNYIALVKSIPTIIEISGYRNDYIAKKLGMKPQNFSAKKQRNNWSPEEVDKLLYILNNEDVQDYLDMKVYEAYEASKTGEEKEISSEEFEKIMGWDESNTGT